jgi:hypothetical protein
MAGFREFCILITIAMVFVLPVSALEQQQTAGAQVMEGQTIQPHEGMARLRGGAFFERVRATPQNVPDQGAKHSHSRAMARVCRD